MQVDITVPIPAGAVDPLHECVEPALQREAARLAASLAATASGALPDDGAPIAEALPHAERGSPAALQLFCPLALASATCGSFPMALAQAGSGATPSRKAPLPAAEAPQGRLRLAGCLHGLAYVGRREPFARAAAAVKADLLASLSTRMALLVEEAEQSFGELPGEGVDSSGANGDASGSGRGAPPLLRRGPHAGRWRAALPRRALFDWQHGLSLCDHMMEDEDLECVAQRASELLALKAGALSADSIRLPEASAAAEVAGPLQRAPAAAAGTQGQAGENARKAAGDSEAGVGGCSRSVALGSVAALVALVAAGLGYLSASG